jgi:hypothetical protein
MWLLRIKNLTPSEVLDLFEDGVEIENNVDGEVHIQYGLKKHLLSDLKHAKKHSLKKIDYEIEKAEFVTLKK